MKIINEKGSQEIKYEIYNMQLNQEKAKRYREELAKKIEFFRLEFENEYDLLCNNGFGLKDFINNNTKNIAKYICEFREISKGEKSVIYGDSINADFPDYHFYSYFERSYRPELRKEDREKGLTQQKDFIEHFVEEGLSDYTFKHVGDIEKLMHTYIFLNHFDYRSKYSAYSCVDNVVYLPNEVITMYLLEKGYIEKVYYYLSKMVTIGDKRKLFANFEFEKSTEFTQEQMQDLLSSGLLEEEVLTRKLSLDLYLTNYIK